MAFLVTGLFAAKDYSSKGGVWQSPMVQAGHNASCEIGYACAELPEKAQAKVEERRVVLQVQAQERAEQTEAERRRAARDKFRAEYVSPAPPSPEQVRETITTTHLGVIAIIEEKESKLQKLIATEDGMWRSWKLLRNQDTIDGELFSINLEIGDITAAIADILAKPQGDEENNLVERVENLRRLHLQATDALKDARQNHSALNWLSAFFANWLWKSSL
jgi:hypothetical protein